MTKTQIITMAGGGPNNPIKPTPANLPAKSKKNKTPPQKG